MKKRAVAKPSAVRAFIDPFASAIERAGTVDNALVVLERLLDAVRAEASPPNLASFLGLVSDWVSEVHARRGTVGARGSDLLTSPMSSMQLQPRPFQGIDRPVAAP